MDESSRRPTASGVARRRRERRLRSWCRHEQQSIRMALGAAAHHSAQQHAAPRSQRTGTRAGEGEVFESREAPRGQNTPSPGGAASTAVGGAAAGVGTAALPWTRLSMPCRGHRLSMFLCRRWSTNSFLTALDSFVPEQVIEVPKISTLSRCPRTVLSVPQTAEQLVEVPTIISYPSLRRIVEQNVNIPAPRGRSRVGLGLHLGQSSTSAAFHETHF